MFESLIETVRSFSFHSVLKGNILSSPGSFGNSSTNGLGGAKSNSPASNMVSNRFLSTYYNKMKEIMDYEINDLSNTIVTIYKDYLIGYLNRDREVVAISDTIPNYQVIQDELNKIFKDLDIVNEVHSHFWDIIYHGGWCFKKAYDPLEGTYQKFYLQNPHNVVTIKQGNDQTSHLVVSRDGTIYEVKADSIFRIGKADLTLINDINKDFLGLKKEDTLIKDDYMVAGTPLYYNQTAKVKEYLLKEQILSLLSIKDLIQPLLLLIRLDKNTSVDEGNRLALNVENMINKYSDISSIISSNFGINSLMDSLMNNIRVIPDYHSGLGDMNNLDLSKVTNKINEIETSLENKKDNIMNANSIPRALYNGESTKWDAIKSSQRLHSRVNSYAIGIADSLKIEAIKLAEERFGVKIPVDLITIHLFKKTEVEYTQAITNTEIVSQLVDGIQRILVSMQQTVTDVKLIEPEKYANYIYNQLKTIDPTISEFIDEEIISKALAELKQQNINQ